MSGTVADAYRDVGSRAMPGTVADAYRDVGSRAVSGTTADALRIVFFTRREIRAVKQDYHRDVVVRATQGAVTGARLVRGNRSRARD